MVLVGGNTATQECRSVNQTGVMSKKATPLVKAVYRATYRNLYALRLFLIASYLPVFDTCKEGGRLEHPVL